MKDEYRNFLESNIVDCLLWFIKMWITILKGIMLGGIIYQNVFLKFIT